MVSSNVIVHITISSRLFVFSQSYVQIFASLTNISGLAVAEWSEAKQKQTTSDIQ